jgi:hypothetical protein
MKRIWASLLVTIFMIVGLVMVLIAIGAIPTPIWLQATLGGILLFLISWMLVYFFVCKDGD